MFLDWACMVIRGALDLALKNPAKREAVRRTFFEIHSRIVRVWPEFEGRDGNVPWPSGRA